jgi:hypothetical protein
VRVHTSLLDMRSTKHIIYLAIYTFGPLAVQADKYLATQSLSARARIRIVASIPEAPIIHLFDTVLSLEHSFGRWIVEQLGSSGLEINGKVVGPPNYIIEDHLNGGVALASKGTHGLPIASWWVATAASFMV